MSLRGGRGAARVKGNADGPRQPRPGFQARARSNVARGTFIGGGSRGRAAANAAAGQAGRVDRNRTDQHSVSTGDPNQRFQLLKKKREEERKQAIRDGFLADPDKPRTLAEAITPVGTCPDMCAEFERLERIVQKDVWSQETRDDGSPNEARMVKKFRRAAAGIDEQMPSDLRPPASLKNTCDYLFDDLIGNAESLGTVHHFVWDRTRAIRNDFSIQQITKPADVETAVECYERIARFHILSLHQFAVPEKPYDKYDWYQEREQLDRTLLSLMQYYDDNRGRVTLKNEPEFRAYCIVFQIQDPIPDLEERVSCYPDFIKNHPRVRVALNLYATACNILDPQGPLKPRAPHPIAKEDWNSFFTKVESTQVSYLSACVAEIYFNLVRRQTLNGIWRAFRRPGNPSDVTDFSLDYLTDLLRFDDPDQTHSFCESYGFGFKELPDGSDEFLDLNSVQGKRLPDAVGGLSAQIFSQSVVENKRMARTFPAIIRGYSVVKARNEGLISENGGGYDEDMQMDGEQVSSTSRANNSSQFTSQAPSNPTSSFPGFGGNPSSSTNPFKTGTMPSTTDTKPFSSPFSNTQVVQASKNTGSTTPAGSPLSSKPGLQDSAFAPNKTSPFSAWGKPSTSAWTTPVTTTAETAQSTQGPTASSFKQAAKLAEPRIADSSKPPQTAMTSMHAGPSSSSWNPPTSPWSKPVSRPAPVVSSTSEDSAKGATVQSQFSTPIEKTTSQQTLPTFSWSKPQERNKGVQNSEPASNFPFEGFSPAQKPESSGSMVSFSNVSGVPAQESSGNSVLTTKPAQSQPTSSVFGTPARGPEASLTAPNPIFSFPSKAPVTEENSQDGQDAQANKPTFGFPAAASAATSSAQQPSGKSIFSDKDAGQKATTPFSFTSASQPTAPIPPQPQSQQHKQPPAQPPQPSSNGSSASNPPKGPLLSFSQPNQPKKRSPLSQSFSAEEDQNNAASPTASINFDTPPRASSNASSTTPVSVFKQPIPTPVTKTQTRTQKPDLATILQKLATEIITDPERGLMRQFVEYHARPIIMSVYEQLYLEDIQEIADNFRREKIAKKYGRKWRETSWRLRLARQGREKREKRRSVKRDRTAAEVAKKRRLEEDAVDDFLKRRSVRMQQGLVNGHSPAPSVAHTARRTSIDSTSTADVELASADADTGSQLDQTRGIDVADGKHRIRRPSKPATPAPSQESANRRSHFLGFSMPKQKSILGDATPKQSSGSTYFRMKAMGLNPDGTSIASTSMGPPPLNLKKRARDDESDITQTPPPHKKSKTPPPVLTNGQGRMRSSSSVSRSSLFQPSPAPSIAASRTSFRMERDDDDIIARARAARQSLRQSTASHRPTASATAVEAMNTVTNGATPSASLQRARLQARLRAVERAENSLAPMPKSPEVPAYRLRESRFVPREHYSRAIERARENVERRSRPPSVISVREDLATPTVTQVPSMEVEISMTKSDSPSARRESNVSQHDDLLTYGSSHNGNNQEQLFGFGKFSQPQTPGVVQSNHFAFESLNALPDAPPVAHQVEDQIIHQEAIMDLMQIDTTPLTNLSNASPHMHTLQGSTFGAQINTHTLSASPYLSIGNDLSQDTSRQSSMYPELTPTHGHYVDHDSQEIPESIPDEHNRIYDVAHQALELQTLETLSDGYSHGATPLHVTGSRSNGQIDHEEAINGFQIDPNLLDPSAMPEFEMAENISVPADRKSGHEEEVVLETQYEQRASKGHPIVSKNSFAALANASEDSEDHDTSPSPSQDSEDEESVASHDEAEVEEHFIDNGSLQDAQRELTSTGTSIPSTTMAAPPMSLNDGPALHTRSHSRSMSQSSRNGRPSLEPVDTTSLGKLRYSLRSSPIVEVPEVEEREEPKEEVGDNIVVNRASDYSEDEESEVDGQSEVSAGTGKEVAGQEGSESVDAEDSTAEESANLDVDEAQSVMDDEEERSYVSEEEEAGSEQELDVDEEESVPARRPVLQDAQAAEEGDYYSDSQDEEGFDDEEEDEEDYDSEDDEEGYISGASRGMTADQLQQSGLVKGGTGQTAEDAFELSD